MFSSGILKIYNDIDEEIRLKKEKWHSDLKGKGYKAVQCYDGWVNENNSTVCLVKTEFDEGIEKGALVMLGDPWSRQKTICLQDKVEDDKNCWSFIPIKEV